MLQKSPSAAPSLRALNCEARRQRILASARQLIATAGVSGLSMRKLAQRAGLSVTTLYNLFGSREDILVALVHDAIDRIDQILEREAPLEDPIERCRAVITVSIRYFAEHEAIFRPMILALYQSLSLEVAERAGTSERAARMQRVAIEAAIGQGLLRNILDPAVLSSQIYHGYEMACCQWAFGRIDETGFEARALYGLYVALLGVAADRLRPELEKRLRRLERELRTRRGARKNAKGSA